MKKRLSLLMVLMMVLSLVPMSVFATAGSVPGGLFSIDDTDENETKNVTVKLTQAAGTEFTTGAKAMLTLNKGDFKDDFTVRNNNGEEVGEVTKDTRFENRATLEITDLSKIGSELNSDGTLNDDLDLFLRFAVFFEDREDAGDVTLTVEEIKVAGITTEIDVAKPIVIGIVKEGTGDDMKVSVKDSDTKIGYDGGELSEITIKDIDKNNDSTNFIKTLELELPDYLIWNAGKTKVSIGGATADVVKDSKDDHIATITLTKAQTKQTIIIKPFVDVKRREASKGDISLKVKAINDAGSKKETVTVTAAQLTDFDVTIKAWEKGKKEIPAMYGGDDATVRVKLSGVKGSFTEDRIIDFTVKGADVPFADIKPGKNLFKNDANIIFDKDGENAEDGEFSLKVQGKDNDELEFDLDIKADWAQNGPVILEADSRDFGKIEVEIAKVTPAYTVETKMTTIKKGESLATADIVIKEAKAGLIDTDKFIVLNLNDRSRGTMIFGADYKVEATNGMKVEDGLYAEDGSTRRDLDTMAIEIKTSSSKEAATITISNVMVKVDGATVDGEKMIDTYIVENGDETKDKDGKTIVKVSNKATSVEYALSKEADLDPDYSVKYVNVVKEYGTIASTTVFKIGSKDYTVNGEAKTANEAPYIAGKGFTMLPVRAVGEALGLRADWNAATKTATFSNDAKIASVVIGADTMFVNGTPFKLSAPAEIKNGSTFVELRSLAQAFGVKTEWDAATKSVTIQG